MSKYTPVSRLAMCKICDAPIEQASKGRPKLYCSTRCRMRAQTLGVQQKLEGRERQCAVTGCLRPAVKNDLCNMHDLRVKKTGDPGGPHRMFREPGTGNINPLNGYLDITKNGRKQGEHRWVMEEMLGRRLLPEENVHHKNGDRLDNRLENLELWSKSQPPGQRVADKLAWARELIALYGDTKL